MVVVGTRADVNLNLTKSVSCISDFNHVLVVGGYQLYQLGLRRELVIEDGKAHNENLGKASSLQCFSYCFAPKFCELSLPIPIVKN